MFIPNCCNINITSEGNVGDALFAHENLMLLREKFLRDFNDTDFYGFLYIYGRNEYILGWVLCYIPLYYYLNVFFDLLYRLKRCLHTPIYIEFWY